MEEVKKYDLIITDKVYRKCLDRGIDTYFDIAVLLGKSESFVKAVFSSHRKKLNLYHLVRLSYELKCSITDFLPDSSDYKDCNSIEEEYAIFLELTKEEE